MKQWKRILLILLVGGMGVWLFPKQPEVSREEYVIYAKVLQGYWQDSFSVTDSTATIKTLQEYFNFESYDPAFLALNDPPAHIKNRFNLAIPITLTNKIDCSIVQFTRVRFLDDQHAYLYVLYLGKNKIIMEKSGTEWKIKENIHLSSTIC